MRYSVWNEYCLCLSQYVAIITKFTLVWKPWKIYVHFYQFSDLWDVTSSWTHLPYLIIVNVTQLAEIGPIYQHQADSGQLWPVNYVMIMYDYNSIIAFRCWNRNIPEQDQLPMYWFLAQYISRHDIEYTEETGHCYVVIVQLRRNDHHGLVMTSLCPQEIVHVPKCWLSPGSWVHAERSATGHYQPRHMLLPHLFSPASLMFEQLSLNKVCWYTENRVLSWCQPFVVTGDPGGCHYGNPRCCRWQQSRHHDDSPFSVHWW